MENQVTQLKLNVTNIKSYLINSNKELKKLRIDKKNLFSKLEKKREYIRKNVEIKSYKKVSQYNLIDFQIQRIDKEMDKIMEQQKILDKFNQR